MTMRIEALGNVLLALALSPLLFGVVNRVKAMAAGRCGKPLLQTYFDLARLLRKGMVISRTTTWVFRAGPVLSVACPLVVLALLPLGGRPGLLSFTGDFILAAYVLGLSRFGVILAALDTGSSFEGMGASREATFGALAEPVLFLTLLAAINAGQGMTLAAMFTAQRAPGTETILVAAAMFLLLLVENARIPVDDPNTHLELTMIHEVMVLDHSGPDQALIVFGCGLKLWIFAALLSGLFLPRLESGWAGAALSVATILATAAVVGVVESCMARLSMPRVPKLLVSAGACSALALIIAQWR